jgi:SAM-dependent methyltransferase
MSITVLTSKPIADDSPDHLHPHGVARDNSVHRPINAKLYELIPAQQVRLLDLGCAGGGFVKSVIDDGGFAVGIEGSDYNRVRNRAEWATIPGNLFTADATEPFRVRRRYDDHLPLADSISFNIITAWEFFEHIHISKLKAVMNNIRWHLAPDGFVFGSISEVPYTWNGVDFHQTVRPRHWWLTIFAELGWRHRADIEDHFGDEWVRGPHSAQPVPQSFPFALSLIT